MAIFKWFLSSLFLKSLYSIRHVAYLPYTYVIEMHILYLLNFRLWTLKCIFIEKNSSIQEIDLLFFLVPLRMDTTIVDIVILRKWKSVIIGGMLIGLMKGLANCLLYWNGGFCWILSLKNSFLMSRKLLLYCLFYLWFYGYYESDISKMAFDKLCNCKRFLSPSLRG